MPSRGFTTVTGILLCSFALLVTQPRAHGQGLGMPGPGGCYEDELEPNPFGAPTILDQSAVFENTGICTSDDWYRVDLRPGQLASFEVSFPHALGDIDITLHDNAYVQLDVSESAANIESLQFVAAEEATIFLRVYGYGDAVNDYVLTFDLEDYSSDCVTAAAGDGELLSELESLWGKVCLGHTSTHWFDVRANVPVELAMFYDPLLGDLDLVVWDHEGNRIAGSATTGRWERLRLFPQRDERLRVDVFGFEGGFGGYEIAVSPLTPTLEPVRVTGQLTYDRPERLADGSKRYSSVHPHGIVVEIIRDRDGFSIARTTTDEDGRFAFSVRHVDPAELRVRVIAGLETPTYRVSVSPSAIDSAHAMVSELLDAYAQPTGQVVVDFLLPSVDPMAGALNIASTARIGLEEIRRAVPSANLDVTFVWDRGQAHACGSCYSDGMILLAGGSTDPDEFDAIVILHELTHLIIDQLSRDDSPGGDHDGTRTRPIIAFAEGIATALAILYVENPVYVDTSAFGVRAYEDIERLPFLQGYGTSDGTLSGQVSEWLPAALIWDYADTHSDDEPFDDLDFRRVDIYRTFFTHLLTERRRDLGAPGVDMADWLNAFRCSQPAHSGSIEAYARGHQGFPFPALGKDKCEWSPVR